VEVGRAGLGRCRLRSGTTTAHWSKNLRVDECLLLGGYAPVRISKIALAEP
jgi:hypothetical protein